MSNPITTVDQLVYSIQPAFEAVQIDKGISFAREAEFAIQIITGNDYAKNIAMQNKQSLVDAVTNVSAIGITLNPAEKKAYLVPRKGGICLAISHIGLLHLAIESGSIRWGQARLVYETDHFELNGLDKQPTHQFKPFCRDRGEVVGVYVSVKTSDGDYLTEAMSVDEVNAIRDRSDAWKAWIGKKKSCPWVTDWGEMAKKTAVHRGHKYWPKTERLDKALHYLNTDGGEGVSYEAPEKEDVERGLDPSADIEGVQKIKTDAEALAYWKDNQKKYQTDVKSHAAFKAAVVAHRNWLKNNSVTDVEPKQ